MKTLLLVLFIFFGMVLLLAVSMEVATFHGPWYFVLGTISLLTGTVLVGCWEFKTQRSNRFGWLFMIAAGAFIVLAALTHGSGWFRTLAGLVYAAAGVIGFIKEPPSEDHGHAHAH